VPAVGAIVVVMSATLARPETAPPVAFTLDVIARGQEATLPLPPSGQTQFSILRTDPKNTDKAVDLRVTAFFDEQGNPMTVDLDIPGLAGRSSSPGISGRRMRQARKTRCRPGSIGKRSPTWSPAAKTSHFMR
jgi:hypothetical protein